MTPGYIGICYFYSDDQMIGFLAGIEQQWDDSKSFYINEICVLNRDFLKNVAFIVLTSNLWIIEMS